MLGLLHEIFGVAKGFAKEFDQSEPCKYLFIRDYVSGGKGIRTPDPLHAINNFDVS
jgi:hypothetical protein